MVGSGPFILVEHVPDVDLELERNPDYHEPGLPYLERIRILNIVDRTTATAAFRTGVVDYVGYPYVGLPSPDPEVISGTVDAGGSAAAFPGGLMALWFDTQSPPFDDRRVRLAVLRAIDPELAASPLGAGVLSGRYPRRAVPRMGRSRGRHAVG